MKRVFSLYDDLPPETAGTGAKTSSTTDQSATLSSTTSTPSSSSSSSTSTSSEPIPQQELNPMAQKILRLQQAKARLKKSTTLLQIKNNTAAAPSSTSLSSNSTEELTKKDEKSSQPQPQQQQQQQQPKVYKVAASSNLLLSDLGYGAEEMVIDPYDPATPNDYSEYARNRSEVRRREKLMRRASKREKKSEIVLNLHITAEEAYLNRARMSGKKITELPPPQLLPSQEKSLSLDSVQSETVPLTPEIDLKSLIDSDLDGVPWFPDNDIIETLHMQRVMRHKMEKQRKRKAAGSKKLDGIGAKIMKRMGWRDGAGLGKQEQGMTAPLVAVRDRDNVNCGEIVPGESVSDTFN